MNYRSVVMLGRARPVVAEREKMRALETITDHIVPNRWAEVRGPNELEMRQTAVLSLRLKEVSAKVRTGPPVDDEEDYALPVWAGVVPILTRPADPVPDARLLPSAKTFQISRFASRGAARTRRKRA
jgi:hypothetical protein